MHTMPPKVMLYALSTCIHCKNTKKYLDDHNVEYDYVYVDQLTGDERKQMIDEVKEFNPKCSFPTIVIGDKCIVGFKKDEINQALGIK
jgi:glutaredoxin